MMDTDHRVGPAKLAVKRHIGTLRAELNYHMSHEASSKEDLELANRHLQQAIAKARDVLRRLSTCLEASGDDPNDCEEVMSLMQIMDTAVMERSKMYDMLFGFQRKGSLDAFVESIRALIETGDVANWISAVTEADMINHGQEINRLFQLLVEGQGAATTGIPNIDSETLARAAERTDFFSSKQCESLQKRSAEVHANVREEKMRLAQCFQEEEDQKQSLIDAAQGIDHPVSLPASSTSWICEHCTFRNERTAQGRCGDCHAPHLAPSFLLVARRKADNINRKGLQSSLHVIKNDSPRKAVVIKKPPTRGSSTNTVWIRNSDVPELIGHGGKNQQALIAKSGATSIYAFQEKVDQHGMCPIEITGNLVAFEAAVSILEKKFTWNAKSKVFAKGASIKKVFAKGSLSKKEVIWIFDEDVAELIGPSGMNIKRLKAETGVQSITAWQEKNDSNKMCPVVIKGESKAVDKAATAIMSTFCGIPDASHSAATGKEERGNTKVAVSFSSTPRTSSSAGSTYPRNSMSIPFNQMAAKKNPSLKPTERKNPTSMSSFPKPTLLQMNYAMSTASKLTRAVATAPTPPSPLPSTNTIMAAALKSGVSFNCPMEKVVKPTPIVANASTIPSPLPRTDTIMTAALKSTLGVSSDCPTEKVAKPTRTVATALTAPLTLSSTNTIMTAAPKSTLGVSSNSPTEKVERISLLDILRDHKNCLTIPPEAFSHWLDSVDISTLEDLADALGEDKFVKIEMKANGLKYFKRFALQEAIVIQTRAPPPPASRSVAAPAIVSPDPPTELVCPIHLVLMVNDPVLAQDGYTYEREAIESWLERQAAEGRVPACSPMTQQDLVDTKLTSNSQIRTLARDWKRTNCQDDAKKSL